MTELQDTKVLIIDDDPALCAVIEATFSVHGASVTVAHSGRAGLRQLYERRPELIILDVRMPEMDGWETCRQIRIVSDVPIIMLTTMSEDRHILRGFDAGVDDYLTKPFNDEIMLAHARAVLRRVRQAPPAHPDRPDQPTYQDPYLAVDLDRHRVLLEGEPVRLTSTEFNLLAYLVQHANVVRTYRQILNNVWGEAYADSPDYVHVYMSHLRRKLERDPRNPEYLLTEHGIGYKFVGGHG